MQFQKKSILAPQEGIGTSWGGGGGGSVRPKKIKEMYEANWNFQMSGGFKKIPSLGEVWIFSGITQLKM